ncbi:hypothetical protein KI387_026427 [Taxus chinensis]|uniref:Uncharacterized protein n=1 Tax=Taxus chinensis TaxID=29808 RepID=A0AA38L8L6_TAXCH|nr:hypothetical protein KI387_026427 [Taxus chinensis]
MDRTSIVHDAISYVQSLQKQMNEMQHDITALNSTKSPTTNHIISINSVESTQDLSGNEQKKRAPHNRPATQRFKILTVEEWETMEEKEIKEVILQAAVNNGFESM